MRVRSVVLALATVLAALAVAVVTAMQGPVTIAAQGAAVVSGPVIGPPG
jgi:hypothetical protein